MECRGLGDGLVDCGRRQLRRWSHSRSVFENKAEEQVLGSRRGSHLN